MNKMTFVETLRSAFSDKTWAIVTPAIYETLYMVFFTTLLTAFFGMFLGISLVVTDRDGIYPSPRFNALLGSVINGFRSLPSMIVIILTLPLSRMIIGISYGPKACIIALAVTCVPMFGRLVESSILEVSKGKIEAARSMGAKNLDIVLKVLLPEALPSLIRSFTISVIAIISTTALAGTLGAGGLGDVAVRFGYSRFKTDVLLAAALVMIVLVQAVQFAGNGLSKFVLKKRHLI
ncbi:MAG: ABC transporter permease [Synergistaceae bacterium]|jgi:D-methionine transport system permease protein|nr:ABC transporter permease [Synergistaceae bacterium]